jgi:phosphoribosylformylglycinamidine synthase
MGLEADLSKAPNAVDKADKMLFSESASRLIVSIPAKNKAKFEKEMKGCAFGLVGKARKDKKFALKFKGKVVVKSDIAKLKAAWQETMRW